MTFPGRPRHSDSNNDAVLCSGSPRYTVVGFADDGGHTRGLTCSGCGKVTSESLESLEPLVGSALTTSVCPAEAWVEVETVASALGD